MLLTTNPSHCLIPILLSTSQTQFPLSVVSEDGRALLYPPSNSYSSSPGKFALRASAAFSASHTMRVHNPFYWPYLENPLVLVPIILPYLSFLSGPAAYSGHVPWEHSVLCLVKITHSSVQITCETLKSQQRPALGGRPSFPSRLPLQSKGPLVNHSLTPCLLTVPPLPTDHHRLFGQHQQARPGRAPASLPPAGRAGRGEETWKEVSAPCSLAYGPTSSSESATLVNTGLPSPPLRNSELLLPSQLWPHLLRELCGPRVGQYTQTPQTHSLIHRSHLGLYFTRCRCGSLVNVCTFRGLEALRTGTPFTFPHYCDPRIQPRAEPHGVFILFF